jgi:NDP-sugar pyrophosphorylase family protein
MEYQMNIAIIEADNSSCIKREGLKSSKHMMKVKGEYLIERIIRIGSINGVKKVFCVINSHEPELEHYLSTKNFGIPLELIAQDIGNSMHNLFALAPFLSKEPFFLANIDSVFIESEFSEFVTYSLLQEDADGVLAVTRYNDDEKPLCVAMNDKDLILKFSNSKEGYNWATGGIYYFTHKIFDEIKYPLQAGISTLEKFLQLLILKGYILKGFSFSKIINVEHVADIAEAENLITGNK